MRFLVDTDFHGDREQEVRTIYALARDVAWQARSMRVEFENPAEAINRPGHETERAEEVERAGRYDRLPARPPEAREGDALMARKRTTMELEQVALSDMHRAPWNPRTITGFQQDALVRSLEEFGVVEPVVINADGMVLGGHQRYDAAEALGWESLPAVRLDLDEKRARLLNLALNRTSGDWDMPRLAEVLQSIDAETPETYALAGFTEAEVEQILANLEGPTAPGEFPSPSIDTRPPVSVLRLRVVRAVPVTDRLPASPRYRIVDVRPEGYRVRVRAIYRSRSAQGARVPPRPA